MMRKNNPQSEINNPQSEIPNQQLLGLFVYGTLKKGFWNFDRFCTRAISIEPATTWGRLYHLPAGFPALEVPESSILATGTADPLADTRTQNETKIPQSALKLFSNNPHSAINNHQSNDWDLVHGELMTFANPGFDLPPIDRLEAFDPNGRSMYQRVLVVAECQDRLFSCWTYHGLDHILRGSLHLPRGYWDGKKFG